MAYTLVTGLLIEVYTGLVLLATQVVSVKAPVATATLRAVALFTPLRRRVQWAVDRAFNRSRCDTDQTVAAFAADLKVAVDLDLIRYDLPATTRPLEPHHGLTG